MNRAAAEMKAAGAPAIRAGVEMIRVQALTNRAPAKPNRRHPKTDGLDSGGRRHLGLTLLVNSARFRANPHHRQQDPQQQQRHHQPRPVTAAGYFGGGRFARHVVDYFPGAPAAHWHFGRL